MTTTHDVPLDEQGTEEDCDDDKQPFILHPVVTYGMYECAKSNCMNIAVTPTVYNEWLAKIIPIDRCHLIAKHGTLTLEQQ